MTHPTTADVPRDRWVRVSAGLLEQLLAAPSEPVTLQIEERAGGELFFTATRYVPGDSVVRVPPHPATDAS